MAEPISIISVVAIGLHSAKKLRHLVESIRDSPREIQTLSKDSESLCDTLEALKDQLEEKEISEVPAEVIQCLQIPLDNTSMAADTLVEKIKPPVTDAGELRTSK